MGQFLAVTFNGADDAEAALQSIRSVEHAGKLGLEDTAVVRKDADGKVTFHNEASSRDRDGRGHRRGARWPPVRRLPGRGDRRRRRRRSPSVGRPRPGHRWRLRQGGRGGPAGRWLGPVPPAQERRSGTGRRASSASSTASVRQTSYDDDIEKEIDDSRCADPIGSHGSRLLPSRLMSDRSLDASPTIESDPPRLSVLIPCWNAATTIERSLASVLDRARRPVRVHRHRRRIDGRDRRYRGGHRGTRSASHPAPARGERWRLERPQSGSGRSPAASGSPSSMPTIASHRAALAALMRPTADPTVRAVIGQRVHDDGERQWVARGYDNPGHPRARPQVHRREPRVS